MKTATRKNTPSMAGFRKAGSDTVQGRLLRGYLHKTSNSLCGIKGYASLIADEQTVHRSPEHWARKIICEVERMEEIFRSVGDLTGTRRIPDLEVNLDTVVGEVVRQCRDTYLDLDIYLGRIPRGDILLPAVDLAILLQETLKNSAEAAPHPGSRIRVDIHGQTQPTGRISLTIQDNGPGIGPELLTQVSHPFITTKPGHLGIGLARVETLLDMYNLAWNLESQPGQGTRLTMETAALKDQDPPSA